MSIPDELKDKELQGNQTIKNQRNPNRKKVRMANKKKRVNKQAKLGNFESKKNETKVDHQVNLEKTKVKAAENVAEVIRNDLNLTVNAQTIKTNIDDDENQMIHEENSIDLVAKNKVKDVNNQEQIPEEEFNQEVAEVKIEENVQKIAESEVEEAAEENAEVDEKVFDKNVQN